MKLNPAERINLLNVIPREGSAATLRIVRDLQTVLGLSEAEHKEFIITMPLPNGSKFETVNVDKLGVLKDVAIGEKARDIIVEALKGLSEKKQLHISMLGLYERFVEGKKTKEDLEDEVATAKMKKANKDCELPKLQGPAKEKPRQKPSK
jgi:hypothetical protein